MDLVKEKDRGIQNQKILRCSLYFCFQISNPLTSRLLYFART